MADHVNRGNVCGRSRGCGAHGVAWLHRRRRPLVLAISGVLALGLAHSARADYPAVVQLSELTGANGFKLDGEAVNDWSGRSVSAAGDINGDGIDELIIGALLADPNGSSSGRSYVVYGRGDSIFADRFKLE
ncbi:MAG: hypothetical protein HND55_02730 [Pseudomonadota bacterium]|nr:MAG: hypothetical protein HND55_02730 [Pseudomonadota bacterium]